MKKKIFKIVLSGFIVLCFFNTAYATLNVETAVDVPTSCSATDTDGVIHNYPQSDSYLTICALETAINNGSISDVQLSNQFPDFGLFITAINGVIADPNSQYWAIYQNGSFANFGITLLPVVAGDTILFQLHDFSDNNLGDQATLHIHSLITPTITPSGSGPLLTSANPETSVTNISATTYEPVKPTFDIKKAFDFLVAQQKENGSFGEDLYTDWIALALALGNNQDQVLKLVRYLGGSKIESPLLTDYERRAMSLMALGLNPYDTNGENYIEKIIKNFDGKQFGDLHQDNDDIFALIVLQNADYTQNDKMISDDINFILGRQKDNGSWDESIDMTGAAIEALASFSQDEQIKNALVKAKEFLKQNQKDTGGWNNASSTAWALEGILALNERPEDWIKDSNTPLDYLATLQDTDGGIKSLPAGEGGENLNTKIWETAYVVSALSGKTWNQIMQKFEKPIVPAIIAETPVAQVAQNTKIKTISAKQKLAKPEKFANQNTATVLNAVQNTETAAPKQPIKKNWFMRLLGSIFGL